ncbi:hypothetical protein HHI36_021752 [Cryptolaemus montrouzieri]|uniref:non-specific serine/threonine protein kinase n=1 Tax=Cryptolaemus montrouzieri TaxID=559131 RepID=A0ABD2MY17_9CUCU
MYIYDLPYIEQKQCCNILDENHLWEQLGRIHMKFDSNTIQEIKRGIICGNSPTQILFTLWGNQNHTVLELFVLLSRMENYRCMKILKKFVPIKYHILIREGVHRLTREIENMKIENGACDKDVGVKPENFNGSEKLLNVPKEKLNLAIDISRENNESSIGEIPKPKSPYLAFQQGRNSRMLTVSDISCVVESAGSIPQISYEDLQKSTKNWDPTTILGKGGFGTVFKGIWKCTQVAIKRLEKKEDNLASHNEQIKQSITELHCLNSYRHDNILPLYGYSISGPQPCLVYQYMPGGCLEHRLRVRDASKVLKWPTRLSIAVGSARGLQFLHTIGDKPLIHGDIKSANILLDKNDMPRIGDFGLAREGPPGDYTHIKVSKIHGTRPYLPDEFLRGNKFSTKVDTYSFGVVLFEIGTALGAYSAQRQNKFLKDHVVDYEGDVLELKDRRAEGGENCFKGLIDIGKMCVDKKAKDRPEMVQVLIELEKVMISSDYSID